MNSDEFRKIPGVDRLIEEPEIKRRLKETSHAAAVETIRSMLTEVRVSVSEGGTCPEYEEIKARAIAGLEEKMRGFTTSVINATGVMIHTNLGRAPLGGEAVEAVVKVASGYSNLEYDVDAGARGGRGALCGELLCELSGAEDAAVVNNNAAALFLALSHHAKEREVVISRGELIQIGGGFRIPDILESSGARLREVGTTNRTAIEDYVKAVNENTALILRAHLSNFTMEGFVSSPSDAELAAAAHDRGILFVNDIGSGAVVDTAKFGLRSEPMVGRVVADGADIVCFSGDKLLGGPQAGIIVGKRSAVSPLKKNPVFRALRPDRMTFAALERTLVHYLSNEAEENVPLLKMMAMPAESIKQRAEAVMQRAGTAEGRMRIVEAKSTVGGGSLPGSVLPTFLIAVRPAGSADELAANFRKCDPPVIARIINDEVCFDLRTVPEEFDGKLAALLGTVIQQSK